MPNNGKVLVTSTPKGYNFFTDEYYENKKRQHFLDKRMKKVNKILKRINDGM